MSCCVITCKNSKAKKEPGITFHQFPKSEERRNAWAQAIGRKNWVPSNSSLICSKHFREEDLDKTSVLKTCVKPNASPIPVKEPSPDPPRPAIKISNVKSMVSPNNSDIVKAAELSIENINLKRKLEKVLAEREEYKKKVRQQENIIKRQSKRIDHLISLIENCN